MAAKKPGWLNGLLNLATNPSPLVAVCGLTPTPNGSSSKQTVGSLYFDPSKYQVSDDGLTMRVWWRAILQTSQIGNAANVDLWDVAGITNAGVPQQVPNSVMVYSAGLGESFVEAELPSLEIGSSLVGPGVLRPRLWLTTPSPGLVATVLSAWLEIEYS